MNNSHIIKCAALALALGLCLFACENPAANATTDGKARTDNPSPKPVSVSVSDPCHDTNPSYPVVIASSLPTEVGRRCEDPRLQRNFDMYGWEQFVALNWPADSKWQPMSDKRIGQSPSSKRVWQGFMGPSAVFLANGERPKWKPGLGIDATQSSKAGASTIRDATQFAVVDADKNFVVFTIGINEKMFKYIVEHNLYSKAGQQKDCLEVDFPENAMEVKAAWRMFPAEPDEGQTETLKRFYHYRAPIHIPANKSATGKARNFKATLALIGFHIAQKTKVERQWTWATFEHVDNLVAPPDGGRATFLPGAGETANMPPIPRDGKSNEEEPLNPSMKPYIWAETADEGYAAPNTNIPTPIKRDVPIQAEKSSPGLNTAYQDDLEAIVDDHSPWANYQLIGVQWPRKPEVSTCIKPKDKGDWCEPTPPVLANIPIEVYNQKERHRMAASSCIGCHYNAYTTNGDRADFSYLLQLAK